MSYPAIHAEFPHLAQFLPFSAEWYRAWQAAHLEKYPDCDQRSRENIESLCRWAESREARP